MKLIIKTLTGDAVEVEGDPGSYIRDLKVELYKTGRFRGECRLLMNKQILEDGSTLQENGIIEGTTLNVLVEREKMINIKIKTPIEEFDLEVLNSISVLDLKEMLLEKQMVMFRSSEYDLELEVSDETKRSPLEGSAVPLHLFGVVNGSVLIVVKKLVGFYICKEDSSFKLYLQLPKSTNLSSIKSIVAKMLSIPDTNPFCLFIQISINRYIMISDDSTRKLGDAIKDGAILVAVVYRLNNTFSINVRTPDKQLCGTVHGVDKEDGKLGVKLKVQDQLGVPVDRINVVEDGSQPEIWVLRYGDESPMRCLAMKVFLPSLKEVTFCRLIQRPERTSPKEFDIPQLQELIPELRVNGTPYLYNKEKQVVNKVETQEMNDELYSHIKDYRMVVDPGCPVNINIEIYIHEPYREKPSHPQKQHKQILVSQTVGQFKQSFKRSYMELSWVRHNYKDQRFVMHNDSLPLYYYFIKEGSVINIGYVKKV